MAASLMLAQGLVVPNELSARAPEKACRNALACIEDNQDAALLGSAFGTKYELVVVSDFLVRTLLWIGVVHYVRSPSQAPGQPACSSYRRWQGS